MKQVASLQYGVMFKKAFCDPEIFTAFVEDCLHIHLEIDHVETEKSFAPPIGNVNVRFDLYAEDRKNRIIVDIQHERYADHYHRFLHYQCAAILEQIANAADYQPAMAVFTIVVLTSGDKYRKDVTITDFDPHDLQGQPLGEIPHKIMYLCPKYANDATPEPLREWLRAIADSLNEQVDETRYTRAVVRRIFDHIRRDDVTPDERGRMIDEYSQTKLRLEEYEKGVNKGKEEGLREGRQENKEATARNLAKIGVLTDEQIAAATGLPVTRIREVSQ